MAEGIISRLTDKGFGFIDMGVGKDLFFNRASLDSVEFEELREGQKVEFDGERGNAGPHAVNVRLVDAD